MTGERETEAEVQAKGPGAPRLTHYDIDACIAAENDRLFSGSQLTGYCLTLRNGVPVAGNSACATPRNFDAVTGRKIARKNARSEIWALEGELLKARLRAVLASRADMATCLTIPGETVDDIAFRHCGTTELLLEANRGLAGEGPVLPGGIPVELPDLPEEPTARPVKLHD